MHVPDVLTETICRLAALQQLIDVWEEALDPAHVVGVCLAVTLQQRLLLHLHLQPTKHKHNSVVMIA